MADVVRWVDTKQVKLVREILMDLNVDEALNAFTASCNRSTETGGSVYATAEAIGTCQPE